MVAGNSISDISFAGTFASIAFAACFAEICTIPLDTAKVRLQLQKKGIAGDGKGLPKYRGMLGTVGTIAKEEGLASLWKGIVPGLLRQCLYGGLRIGLYEPIKNFYVGDNFVGDVPLTTKILAGLTTVALAIAIANPTDLVKVRLQAEGKLPAGVPRRYSGALNAYSSVVRQEGVGALWTGIGPNVARNAIINAAELASYDQLKQSILKIPGFTDNIFTHLLSGLGAGFFAVCIGSSVDVVKSRMMGDPSYTSTIDCFVKTLKNDGPLAFYKGFIPNFGRLCSWNVIMFLTLEQIMLLDKSSDEFCLYTGCNKMASSDESFFYYSIITLFIITPLTFISTQFITAPYGKHHRKGWGPTLPPSLAWFLMESPTLWFSLLLFQTGQHRTNPKSIILISPFIFHYIHRTIIYPLRIRRKLTNGYPISVALIAFVYNLLNSYLQTRYVSEYADYDNDGWFWMRFCCGLFIFGYGMVVNVKSDMILVKLKDGKDGGYKIPKGGFFELVSCANYFGEIVEWLGWWVMTGSWVGLGFLLFTCANLVPRAGANHKWYLEKFGEDYPKGRKAIIPFLY